MATRPEYGEELLIEEREEEIEESSRGPLPRWEDIGAAEVAEQGQAEEQAHHPGFESHEARRPGAVCDHCGAVIAEDEDARRTAGGRWVHEVCP